MLILLKYRLKYSRKQFFTTIFIFFISNEYIVYYIKISESGVFLCFKGC